MTTWTPCPILVGEPDHWDTAECSRRRKLSGVAQGIEDLRAVAAHFKRDPDATVAAWDAYARENDDDSMETFNAFIRTWNLERSGGMAAAMYALGQSPIIQAMARAARHFEQVGIPQAGYGLHAAFQPALDNLAALANSQEIRQLIAELSEPEPTGATKPPRRCYRCAESHGSKPCRQTLRGKHR